MHVNTDLTNTYAFYYYNWVQDTTSYQTFNVLFLAKIHQTAPNVLRKFVRCYLMFCM